MSEEILYAIGVLILYLGIRLLNSTDTPKIKNLPEIPGVPIFGNLIQLGTDHARVAQKWARKYGPVFQTRLGNRVCFNYLKKHCVCSNANPYAASRLCKLIRFR